MFNRARAIVPVAIVAVLGTAPVAAARLTHEYTSTVMSTPVLTANSYPAPGGSAVFAGSVRTNVFGAGGVIDRVTITGHSQANVLTFRGTEVALFRDGVAASTFTGTATIHDDGSQSIIVNGHLTPGRNNHHRRPVLFGSGGTGRYQDATGSYAFTGTVLAGSNEIVGTSTGAATF
jgi:hypothetical protein